jgi:hypothetical protein
VFEREASRPPFHFGEIPLPLPSRSIVFIELRKFGSQIYENTWLSLKCVPLTGLIVELAETRRRSLVAPGRSVAVDIS